MKIKYVQEDSELWFAETTLSDTEGDEIDVFMFLTGGDNYELHMNTSDLRYILWDSKLLENLNTFVSKAKEKLEELEE